MSLERSLCVSKQGILQAPHWILSREEEGECDSVVKGGDKGLCESDRLRHFHIVPMSLLHLPHVSCMCVHYRTCVSVTAEMSCNKWDMRGGGGGGGSVSGVLIRTCEWVGGQ